MTRTLRSHTVWALALFAVFAVVTLAVVMEWTQAMDESINSLMVASEVAWLVAVGEAFHVVGSVPPAFVVTALVVIMLFLKGEWNSSVTWLAAVGVAVLLSAITKELVGRARPLNGLVAESSLAFPSGHAMNSGSAMAIGLALVASFIWPGRRRLFLVVGIIYAAVMGLSRVYLRAHWMTDVIGGWLFGAAVALAVVAVGVRLGASPASVVEA